MLEWNTWIGRLGVDSGRTVFPVQPNPWASQGQQRLLLSMELLYISLIKKLIYQCCDKDRSLRRCAHSHLGSSDDLFLTQKKAKTGIAGDPPLQLILPSFGT